MPSLKERLSALLVQNKTITPEQLEEALKMQKESKGRIGDILVNLGYITSDNLIEVLSAELGIPFIRLRRYKIQPQAISSVPKKMAQLYGVMPLSKFGNSLTVAMKDPMNVVALDDLRRATGTEIRPLLADEKEIKESIDQYYADNVGQALEDVVKDLDEEQIEIKAFEGESSTQDLLKLTEEEPVVKFTNLILYEGVKRRSNDVFVEPEEQALRVRYRVDGVLQEGVSAAKSLHAGVVSRIKVMSNLDIAEHRIPQDGRFKIKIKDKDVDFRVSILPTYFGEKVVLRVLDKQQAVLDLEKLDFERQPLDALKKASVHPHGMIVVCGPTGSGKTTTLYALLTYLNSPYKNLVTVEDPVEFQLPGINQVVIRQEVNLTFAASLRSILRQDPNIIMVGEIRDGETADIAIKAALTGHLVLTTLHATTATGAITRLLNMNIEPFLITSSILFTGSQRLVRKICLKCKEAYEPTPQAVKALGITDKHLHDAGLTKPVFYRGAGCEACHRQGFSGRTVLLEGLSLSPKVKDLILKGAAEYQIKKVAREEGMLTLRENGLAKILRGVTTPEEVIRSTVRDQEDGASFE